MVVEPPVNTEIFTDYVRIVFFNKKEDLEKVRLNLALYLEESL